MLEAGIKNSGLEDMFDFLLSTDAAKQFKPAPRAYQMAVDAFRLNPEAIAFAAFAGWDIRRRDRASSWPSLPPVVSMWGECPQLTF